MRQIVYCSAMKTGMMPLKTNGKCSITIVNPNPNPSQAWISPGANRVGLLNPTSLEIVLRIAVLVIQNAVDPSSWIDRLITWRSGIVVFLSNQHSIHWHWYRKANRTTDTENVTSETLYFSEYKAQRSCTDTQSNRESARRARIIFLASQTDAPDPSHMIWKAFIDIMYVSFSCIGVLLIHKRGVEGVTSSVLFKSV